MLIDRMLLFSKRNEEVIMNAKNYDLFFNEDADETTLITLTDEDGNSFDTEIIAAIEIEELEKEYVAALPTEPNKDFEEGEVLLLIYTEDANGDPDFAPVEDEEEFEIVSAAFEQFFEEEEDEEYSEDDYLDDISDMFPGVSFKKE